MINGEINNEEINDGVPSDDLSLDKDARHLQDALAELVRVYQFRDRQRICYYDVSATQCYAMGTLISSVSMTLGGLAKKLFLDKSTTSRIVDNLESKGYIYRSTDPGDARALSLEVTEKGRALHLRIQEDLVEEMKILAADIDPGIRQSTALLMEKLTVQARKRFTRDESS